MIATAQAHALVPGNKTYVVGSGGTPPYSYAVNAGGAGGTINPVTGLYTAPIQLNLDAHLNKFQDVITVTDSLLATATAPILVGSHIFLLCDILQRELGLAQGQVYLWDQKINTPTDEKLYIAVGILSCKPYANNIRQDPNDATKSNQYTNFLATLSIDIMSRGPQARDRKEEVIMALKSMYSQQQQELNGFYVAPLSTGFANLSQEDGAAIPYRFNISVNMQYCITKVQAINYYDNFDPTIIVTEP